MRSFTLQVGADQLAFDTDGNVQDSAANLLGRWTTSANDIVYTPTGKAAQKIAVDWAFNDKNQLTIAQVGKTVLTLINTADGLAGFHLENNVLWVDPDGDLDFKFSLNCLYGLDKDGNLIVSIKDRTSVLDGVIEDKNSRFRFRFDDKETPSFPNSLVFSGTWERIVDPAVANQIRLHFLLDDKTLEISTSALNLPAQVQVDRSRNHLSMVYRSKNFGDRTLQFQGSVDIGKDFTLTFQINDVKDGGVHRSEIVVETTFNFEVATGFINLRVGRNLGQNQGQVIQLGGAVKAKLKNGVLNLDFSFRKDSTGGQTTKTIAANVSFETPTGNKLLVSFSQDGQTRTVDVSANFSTARFAFSGGVKVQKGPPGRTIVGFLGLAW